jgi:hypothetical protein
MKKIISEYAQLSDIFNIKVVILHYQLFLEGNVSRNSKEL